MASYYRVKLKYDCFVGDKSLNNLLKSCGFDKGANLGVKTVISISSIFLEVPTDKEKLNELGKVLMSSYNESNGQFFMFSCKFSGYGNISKEKNEIVE